MFGLGLDAITVAFAYTFRGTATGYFGAVIWMQLWGYGTTVIL